MRTDTSLAAACTAIVLCGAAAPARTAIVENILHFEARSFAAVAGGSAEAAPVDPVRGIIHVRFDNSAGFFHAAHGTVVNGVAVEIVVSGLNLPWNGSPVISYLKDLQPTGKGPDALAVSQGPTTSVDPGNDDWRLIVSHVSSGGPGFDSFWYGPRGSTTFFGTDIGTVQAVPEPAAIWSLAMGLCVLAGVAQLRRGPGRARVRPAVPAERGSGPR